MVDRIWKVYLSGESHSDWRERISEAIEKAALPIRLDGPVCVHQDSYDCGVPILGAETDPFWHARKGASVNAIRTRTRIGEADVVVVRFGEKYRQWNAAFDAGLASALGKAVVSLHGPELNHALKEVDAAAMAVCQTPEQVVQVLTYVIKGRLPGRESALAAE